MEKIKVQNVTYIYSEHNNVYANCLFNKTNIQNATIFSLPSYLTKAIIYSSHFRTSDEWILGIFAWNFVKRLIIKVVAALYLCKLSYIATYSYPLVLVDKSFLYMLVYHKYLFMLYLNEAFNRCRHGTWKAQQLGLQNMTQQSPTLPSPALVALISLGRRYSSHSHRLSSQLLLMWPRGKKIQSFHKFK